jgi:hypothetical protein
MRSLFILVVAFVFLGLKPRVGNDAPKAFQIAVDMFAQTKKIETLTYTIRKLERFKTGTLDQLAFVKLNREPLKVYTKKLGNKGGVEVLYIAGEHNNMALINPNGFPWVSLRLDPYGSIMRKDQHHIIQRSGFDHVISILEFLFKKYGDATQGMTSLSRDTTWQGRECWVIGFDNPNFKYEKYAVAKGENLLDIASRSKLSEHMILEINPHLSDFNDVKEGDIIEVPNDYATKMILFIDKQSNLPVVMKVFDDKGLYEQYEFQDLKVNPKLEAIDFSPDNKQYGF